MNDKNRHAKMGDAIKRLEQVGWRLTARVGEDYAELKPETPPRYGGMLLTIYLDGDQAEIVRTFINSKAQLVYGTNLVCMLALIPDPTMAGRIVDGSGKWDFAPCDAGDPLISLEGWRYSSGEDISLRAA